MLKTNTAAKTIVTELPTFNEVIEIKVPVQAIYEKLLGEFPEDYKHRELVAHSIIGSSTSGLGYIYNALNGYSPAIDFEVGDNLVCTSRSREEWYDKNGQDSTGKVLVSSEDMKPNWGRRDIEVGQCKIVEINLYGDDKLRVEFVSADRYNSGKSEVTTKWVNHKKCTKVFTVDA